MCLVADGVSWIAQSLATPLLAKVAVSLRRILLIVPGAGGLGKGFHFFRLGAPIHLEQQCGVVFQGRSDVGMLRPQRPFPRIASARLKSGSASAYLPWASVKLRQVVEARGHIGMLRPGRLLQNRQCERW